MKEREYEGKKTFFLMVATIILIFLLAVLFVWSILSAVKAFTTPYSGRYWKYEDRATEKPKQDENG